MYKILCEQKHNPLHNIRNQCHYHLVRDLKSEIKPPLPPPSAEPELTIYMGFPSGLAVKNLPANAGDAGSIPGGGRSPGHGNSNPLSILAWEIPWTEEPGGVQSLGLQRAGHD